MSRLARALLLMVSSLAFLSAQEITVSAGASLTESFREIGALFEKQHPGTRVVFNFTASDKLLQQINAGAPVDVFASADQVTMDKAVASRAVDPSTRSDFARNALVLIIPADAKAVPRGPKDLLGAVYSHTVLGNPASVPAGRYAKEALEIQGLWKPLEGRLVLTQTVRQALDYVARGEAEAGLVFATDALILKDKVRVIGAVPTSTPITYPIAVVASTPKRATATAFLRLVTGPEGRSILTRRGFGTP